MARAFFVAALLALPWRPSSAEGCPEGRLRRRTEDPFVPVRCVAASAAAAPAEGAAYSEYRVPGSVRISVPREWRVIDAWSGAMPSLYAEPRFPLDGKPVLLSVSRVRSSRELRTLMRRELEWHGARETGRGSVAGAPARFLEIPGEAKLAYVSAPQGHFVLSYTAPEDLFASYAPAFERLLQTISLSREAGAASASCTDCPPLGVEGRGEGR